MNHHHHRAVIAAVPLAVALTLTGCTTSTESEASAPSTAAATLAATDDNSTPAEVPAETPAGPVADDYSQVVNGVLYQGTATAPVRIGTDTPGQPPAAEATFTREGWKDWVKANNKYAVSVAEGDGGWLWKAFAVSQYGSVREISNSGYQSGTYLPSREAAAAGPFVVDGRTLDRAEFVLVVN